MKTRALKYWRKNWLLYCSSFSSVPHPRSLQSEGGRNALGGEKGAHKRSHESNGTMEEPLPVTWKQRFWGWNEISSPFIEIQVSNSKVHLHNIYYAALFLSQGSSSWMHKLLCLCCHDLVYHPETPRKSGPFICLWQAMGSIYFTLQHSTRILCSSSVQENQAELCDSGFLISSFLHENTCPGPAACSLVPAQWQQEGHQVTSPFLPFPNRWLQAWSAPAGWWGAALHWGAGSF